MAAEAGPAFAHYVRTDESGARPVPPDLLGEWVGRGWLVVADQVDLGDCGHDNYRPGVVLDPFGGAGTTAVVARRLGRHAVLVELNPEYAEMAAERCRTYYKKPLPVPEQVEGQLSVLGP
jgi:hypothetical protein